MRTFKIQKTNSARVTKPGNQNRGLWDRDFVCNKCGCEFTAEWEDITGLETAYGDTLKATCPECGNLCRLYENRIVAWRYKPYTDVPYPD